MANSARINVTATEHGVRLLAMLGDTGTALLLDVSVPEAKLLVTEINSKLFSAVHALGA